jgi:hypothetical protein
MLNRRAHPTVGTAAAALAPVRVQPAWAETSPALAAQSRTIDIGGGTIAYRRFGAGKPLLFLQRFRGGMDDWDTALLDALASGREVILSDSLRDCPTSRSPSWLPTATATRPARPSTP